MKYITKFYQQRKQRIVNAMGGKCALCGYDKCISALEMHHIDPETKSFNFSDTKKYHTWEELIPEMKKCILLCANCHREIHSLDKDELIKLKLHSSYDENISNQILEEIQAEKTKTNYYCVDCGKQISYKATRCEACAKIQSRIVENRPDREELKKLIRVKPFTKIGEQYGVSDNAIRKWCDLVHLPRTKKEINSYSDEDWEKI